MDLLRELPQHLCIAQGAMAMVADQAMALDHAVQVVARMLRKQLARQLHRAQDLRLVAHADAAELAAQEAVVEARIVGNQDLAFEPAAQRTGQLRKRGRAFHHGIGDAGQLLDIGGNGPAGIDQRAPFADEFPAIDLHQPDLGDAVERRGSAGGLEVEENQRPVKHRAVAGAGSAGTGSV